MSNLEQNSIDDAIATRTEQISRHNASARRTLSSMVGLILAVLFAITGVAWYQLVVTRLGNATVDMIVPEWVFYGAGLVIVIVISVFTSLYRFHLREVTKNEQFKIGFQRIRIAANNVGDDGFQTEVRQALSIGAFDLPRDGQPFALRKQVESPLPGHPTSDAATAILNKILEQIDVRVDVRK